MKMTKTHPNVSNSGLKVVCVAGRGGQCLYPALRGIQPFCELGHRPLIASVVGHLTLNTLKGSNCRF